VPTSQDALDAFVTTQLLDNGMDAIASKINMLREKLLRSGSAGGDAQSKKKWARQLQHWLALACRLLAKQRRQLSHCIEHVERDYSRGEIGLGSAKHKEGEEEDENLYSRTYARPRASSSAATAESDGYVGTMVPSTEDILAVGCHVAAKVARSHELWIMARVVKFNADSNTYEVEDVDSGDEDEDDTPRRHYFVPWQQVVELPGDSLPEGEWIHYAVDERVMAMYPNTTSFFRSTVRVPNPRVRFVCV
jgi:SAGA-associated factor 29